MAALSDRDRWNAKHREAGTDDTPNLFLPLLASELPASGRALDLACGRGADAVWLAQQGLTVTACDVSEVALALTAARAAAAGVEVACVEVDLSTQPLPPGPFDVITCFNFLERRLFGLLPEALVPGGLFIFSQPTVKNLERHAHPSARFLLDEGELQTLVAHLDVVQRFEGWAKTGRHEAHVVARRRG